jgi:hypothetical protein
MIPRKINTAPISASNKLSVVEVVVACERYNLIIVQVCHVLKVEEIAWNVRNFP